MPLTIRLKPGERLTVNGAVLRNASKHAVVLDVLNHVTMLHERDLMLPEQAATPLEMLYFQIQMMHLEPENHDTYFRPFIQLSAQIYAEEMQRGDAELRDLVSDLISLVGQRNFPQALRRLQKRIGKPGDRRGTGGKDETSDSTGV